ncbi:NAD-dependent epimerase/dehydratase family protein [Lysobacter soyae]|uniref:NAD-dependent epimerase/dehydratase family protein n=1 Tax=Lysobacter soyae TaxID=2764185 RepID=A0ABX8WPP3_9GAMM|nr:NAD-dependent epimerase/dehydratase family protein [Lysobacter sp. CJ11]QYR52729.1 NAD-dependent epimerase/dehydratase family protein [Lysobacter sp. CJ11]
MKIVGNGLLANAVRACGEEFDAVVFASGVSNSSETRASEFDREYAMLCTHLEEYPASVVYFSTCSISDPDRANSPYVKHKLNMERLVGQHPKHQIFRLPQVVGLTPNPHTLTNFIATHLQSGERFAIWGNAVRCLVDVEDVARISVQHTAQATSSGISEIAPPEVVSMLELVGLMESVLRRTANFDVVDSGGGSTPDSAMMVRWSNELEIDVSPGYTFRVLQKYYGSKQ